MIAEEIKEKRKKIAVIGLGYVGLPLAVEFAQKCDVIGFDINADKIEAYIKGIDLTKEVGDEELRQSSIYFTSDERELKKASFLIVAVPTPVNQDKTPDLYPIEAASKIVGRNLSEGAIVVYESTVYPGVTEEVCIPILEEQSGLKCGQDFWVGYSPERINPGDKVHRLKTIKKIVSGQNEYALRAIKEIYELIIEAGTFTASSIRTAEAIKVAENSQRDINIAFLNELAKVFDRMGIDTNEVVDGMNTKWNALGFRPGLVGGHCIGVDPYYFIYQAEKLGYHSQLILAGRQINDSMGQFVADAAIQEMILAKQNVAASKVLIMGITFKENCPDIRNSKVLDICERLNEYRIEYDIWDPVADREAAYREYGVKVLDRAVGKKYNCIILAVAHEEFKRYAEEDFSCFLENFQTQSVLIDVKGILSRSISKKIGCRYWSL